MTGSELLLADPSTILPQPPRLRHEGPSDSGKPRILGLELNDHVDEAISLLAMPLEEMALQVCSVANA